MRRVAAFILLLLAQPFLGTFATAHEMRPAYLDMKETAEDQFSVLWKVPALGDLRLGLYVRLPDNCAATADPVKSIEQNSYFERWSAHCQGGLRGKEIGIDGLRATLTDVLSRIQYRDGSVEITRLTPASPSFNVKGVQTTWEVARTYFQLGVDHILSGLDHLLFVLALVLLIHNRWMLFKTITAFTLAHSLTLAGASLGYFSLPQKPVEATIALSIAFVASELVKMKPGERRLSEAYPWLVAFTFGLLHGFGFAGALKEIGLPQVDVPLALLTFNLGVEAGQLLFVTGILMTYAVLTTLIRSPLPYARTVAAYVIGAIATAWFLDRMMAFLIS